MSNQLTESARAKIIDSALTKLKSCDDLRSMYKALYGEDPDRVRYNQFANRFKIDRGNPSADFIGHIVKTYPELQSMTLGEFFGLKPSAKKKTAAKQDEEK